MLLKEGVGVPDICHYSTSIDPSEPNLTFYTSDAFLSCRRSSFRLLNPLYTGRLFRCYRAIPFVIFHMLSLSFDF